MLHFKRATQLLSLCLGLCSAGINAQGYESLPNNEVVVVKPEMLAEPLTATLYSVSTEKLLTYLRNIIMFDSKEQFDDLPYVVAFDNDKHIAGPGDVAYTRGLTKKGDISSYSFLVPGKLFKDPGTDETIGFQAFVTGTAEVRLFGDPETVMITDSLTIIEPGTRLIPSIGIDLPATLDARYPDKAMSGYVLAVSLNQAGGGDFSVVMLSLNAKDGLKQGHVLDLLDGNREVLDVVTLDNIALPPSKFGEVLIYKVGEKISLGVVTFASHIVSPKDVVRVAPQDF